jgi:hypothetical protein
VDGRQERFLIPGTVAFLAALLTLWACAGLETGPVKWLPFIGTNQDVLPPVLSFIAALGIANLGVGYMCHIIYTAVMLKIDCIRFIDLRRLVRAFGLDASKVGDASLQRIREDLLAEFHLRLHSHAPASLVAHCSRRNSGWYIAQTSALALVLGWVFAVLVMTSQAGGLCQLWSELKSDHPFSSIVVTLLFVVLLPVPLWWQGHRWNREFWEVCWKWIGWDVTTHPCGDWLRELSTRLHPRIEDEKPNG